jgi:hypothetical protein
MLSFLRKHAASIIGVLTGFDRVVFRGTLRQLAYSSGIEKYVGVKGVRYTEYNEHVESLTEEVTAASKGFAYAAGRPYKYLESPKTNKEEVALEIAKRDGVKDGLICVLGSVEPCRSFEIRRNEKTNRFEFTRRLKKCLFLYHYAFHPVFGFMNARIQTWLPFDTQICINGREWLAREMDKTGLAYRRHDNCFPWIEDVEQAQRLMDKQTSVQWPELLNGIARQLNPIHDQMFDRFKQEYYWSTHQSEVATDIMFRDAASLAAIYPSLVHHAITSFGSPDVMRFMGHNNRLTQDGEIRANFSGDVVSDLKLRVEGVRVKHSVNGNGEKLYDKGAVPVATRVPATTVLRAEFTMNNPTDFKVYRPAEGGDKDDLAWRPLRKGIADLHRRVEVSRAANERYLEALSVVDASTPLSKLTESISRHATDGKGKRVRALNPYSRDDAELLAAVNRGEFCINGFRNRDIRNLIFGPPSTDVAAKKEERRRAGVVTRKIRLLRTHGLIRKVPRTHRYLLTDKGREVITAVLTASAADVKKLTAAA